ncbi:exo-beta-N-acetylmuramidase NamZ domain-containing protein [Myxococcota bacterium]
MLTAPNPATDRQIMLCGLDLLFDPQCSALRRRLRNARMGLLTHAAAVDRRGRQTISVLEELGSTPFVVFSPEHGLHGVEQAEIAVSHQPQVGDSSAPTISLYGTTKESLVPDPVQLSGLEVLLIDLADVGSRYYTYVWTAWLTATAARERGIHVVVLDRPNPISGAPCTAEGAPQCEGYLSLVGLRPLPIRHAMTVAEILVLLADRDDWSLGPMGSLSVVPSRGWERHRTAEAWGRPFVMPSPNIPTVETALVYPGACLLEGTNLSEGRGTTAPFQLVGAPFLDGAQLACELGDGGVPGAMVRAVQFRPWMGKHRGEICHGVMVHVTNSSLFRPVATYLRLIALARRQAPEAFAFRTDVYEFETETLAFDLLTGSSAAREALQANASPEEVVALVAPVEESWAEVVRATEARAVAASA